MFDTTKILEGVIANGVSIGISTPNSLDTFIQYINRTITDVNDVNGDIKTLYDSQAGAYITFAYHSYLSRVNLPSCSRISPSTRFTSCINLIEVNMPMISSLNDEMFRSCTKLESVNLRNISSISRGSIFCYCTNLQSIDLPNLVSINAASSLFYGCTNLQNVSFPNLVNISNAGSLFAGCSNLRSISFPNLVNISNASYMFNYCSSLQNVSFPNLVSIVNTQGLLSFCTNLQNVSFPNLVSMSGNGIFMHCENLRSISFPNIVYLNGSAMFNYCSNLSIIVIGTSNCELATSQIINAGTPIHTSDLLGYYGSIYVPDAYVEAYKVARNWSYWASRITGISNLPTE